MNGITVELTTEASTATQQTGVIRQAKQVGSRATIPNREMSRSLRDLLTAAVELAAAGVATKITVLVYPTDLLNTLGGEASDKARTL